MLSNILKNFSILKKFLFINFIFFLIISIFTTVYIYSIQPSLIKDKSANHYKIIDNTVNHIQRLNISFIQEEIRKFLISTKFLFQTIDRVIIYDKAFNSISDTDALDLDPRSFSRNFEIFETDISNSGSDISTEQSKDLKDKSSFLKNKLSENKIVSVLVENKIKNQNRFFGRTENMTPVIFESEKNYEGKIVSVLITHSNQNNLFGELKLNKNFKAA